jgi:hypothetical protein
MGGQLYTLALQFSPILLPIDSYARKAVSEAYCMERSSQAL